MWENITPSYKEMFECPHVVCSCYCKLYIHEEHNRIVNVVSTILNLFPQSMRKCGSFLLE